MPTPAGKKKRRGSARRAAKQPKGAQKGRLKVHDPFELIRWLALSQADPRKALAELVQNSLDAGAHVIRVTRVRQSSVPCLKIWDDGEGVIPELDRPEALKYIATHVGHSRKRSLSPQERFELMTQGQYGIGLLGFWSLGEMLELRTSIPGHRAHRLILYRDRPDYLIEPLRGRLPFDERWTEVVVAGLHREAMPALACRRAGDYLASELRGQLLAREVELVLHDRIARGRALKRVEVRPRRFLGERLEGLGPVPVPEHAAIQMEIYLVGEETDEGASGISVYAAGTLVAESFDELSALDLDHPPWTDPRLAGMVDFPDLSAAPGSRRGIVPDSAAGAFVRALADVEPTLAALLEGFERRRAEELDRTLIRDLQRAFRDFYRRRPRYTMLPARDQPGDGGGTSDPAEEVAGPGMVAEGAAGGEDAEDSPPALGGPLAELFDLGPLAEVRIRPSPVRVERGGRRPARCRAFDGNGRELTEDLTFRWRLSGSAGRLEPDAHRPDRVTVVGAATVGEGTLCVDVRQGDWQASAEAAVEVVEELPGSRSREGIPEPVLVNRPAAPWRSRIRDGRWQVNSGHPEFRQVADRPSLKLRYLALLFAKEVVLRSSQDPRLESPLEQMVEVAAYANANLGLRGKRRRRGNR